MLIRLARPSSLLAALLALGSLALPRSALAWVDARVAGDDVRIDVSKDGSARVEHKITLRISGGPLRALDLRGVDADAIPETDAYVVPGRDAASGSLAQAEPVSVEMLPPSHRTQDDGSKEPSVMRVRFDADKGLSRGVFVVFVRYKTELFRRGLIRRDGSMAQLRWSGLSWNDGFDSARATFILPAGPTEPRPDESTPDESGQPGAESLPASTLSTLRRGTGRDELELLRPYAPKGEAVQWLVRFDARALEVTAAKPKTADAPMPQAPSSVTPARRDFLFIGAGLVFVLYSLLVALKSREVIRTTAAAGAKARPLIPLPVYVRSVAAGLSLTGGLLLELFMRTGTLGAIFVAFAAALSMHRAPTIAPSSRLRGPGMWLPITEEEAFARPPRRAGTWLDSSTRAGKALLFMSLVLLGVAVWFVSDRSMYHAYLLGFDAVAIFAIFCTGRLSDVPLDAVSYAKPFLQKVAKRIRKAARKTGDDIRIIPRIRVPEGSAIPDEMRLAIVPRAPLTGFVGLEVGVVPIPSPASAVHSPEMILRVTTGSPCEESIVAIAEQGKSQRGRRSSERAITLAPRLPTTWMTADLVMRLVTALREARKAEERSGIRRTSQMGVEQAGAARVA
ncbi:MAG: hypothetical protein IPM54_45485 [Polyangiaceae bacterium]|nr:hypothetical protein [Polyangiaceae bacterium]